MDDSVIDYRRMRYDKHHRCPRACHCVGLYWRLHGCPLTNIYSKLDPPYCLIHVGTEGCVRTIIVFPFLSCVSWGGIQIYWCFMFGFLKGYQVSLIPSRCVRAEGNGYINRELGGITDSVPHSNVKECLTWSGSFSYFNPECFSVNFHKESSNDWGSYFPPSLRIVNQTACLSAGERAIRSHEVTKTTLIRNCYI